MKKKKNQLQVSWFPKNHSHRNADTFKNVVSRLTPACPYKPNAQMVSFGSWAEIKRENGKQGHLELICNANVVPSFIFGSNSLQQFIDNVNRGRACACVFRGSFACLLLFLAGRGLLALQEWCEPTHLKDKKDGGGEGCQFVGLGRGSSRKLPHTSVLSPFSRLAKVRENTALTAITGTTRAEPPRDTRSDFWNGQSH